MSKASVKTTKEWRDINWRKLERRVYKLQKRIYRASQRGDVKVVRRLQKTLMKSWSARALAVRRVTQDNQGKKTAGVDGIKSLTPKQRLSLTGSLKLSSKVQPTRRVWIDKPGKDEKRPLGIPTMYDRTLQALVKLGLEPEWEARFEPNSYGFRPGRSCHDAISAIFMAIRCKPKFVLDADIAKCFDKINHERLLEKLNTYPTLRKQIRAWLKAGVIDKNELFPTAEGTPQGGVISPLLANIALHGMEERINKEFPYMSHTQYFQNAARRSAMEERINKEFPYMSHTGRETWFHKKGTKFMSPTLIRYADDFVILHENIAVIQRSREIISEWLKDMGLELKPSKTKISHTLFKYDDEIPGFNFLGFNIKQWEVGKYHSGKHLNQILGFKTIIKPSKESIHNHYHKLSEIIDSNKTITQIGLIEKLNPLIRGWSNYYSGVVSKAIYQKLDALLHGKLQSWAQRRHPQKGHQWVARKYWKSNGERNWIFMDIKDGNPVRLTNHSDTAIVRHTKVKGELSPYDGNEIYWSSRMGNNPGTPKRVATLLKRQKGKCAQCELYFREEDVLEIDHITPKTQGGKDEYKNLQLLHRHCHDNKTNHDGSSKRGTDEKQPNC
jgi:RNA-directed DNA polymerase